MIVFDMKSFCFTDPDEDTCNFSLNEFCMEYYSLIKSSVAEFLSLPNVKTTLENAYKENIFFIKHIVEWVVIEEYTRRIRDDSKPFDSN